jgi:hypothetical protein
VNLNLTPSFRSRYSQEHEQNVSITTGGIKKQIFSVETGQKLRLGLDRLAKAQHPHMVQDRHRRPVKSSVVNIEQALKLLRPDEEIISRGTLSNHL